MSVYRKEFVSQQVLEIDHARQSIPGWRWAIDYALELIGDLATLKGAQAYRGRIDTIKHEATRSLCVGDLVILRNSTACADLAIALAEADKLLPGRPWMMMRGMGNGGPSEFGFAVYEGADDEAPLAIVTHADPRVCVAQAVETLRAANSVEAVA